MLLKLICYIKNNIYNLNIRRKFKLSRNLNIIISKGIKCTNPQNIIWGGYNYIGGDAFLLTQGKLKIGVGTILGPKVSIYTANHNYENADMLPYDGKIIIKPVIIEDFVWIGGNVVILLGVTIGEGAVVASGCVVSKSVPPLAVVGGNPIKIIKYRDEKHYYMLKEKKMIYVEQKLKKRVKTEEIIHE